MTERHISIVDTTLAELSLQAHESPPVEILVSYATALCDLGIGAIDVGFVTETPRFALVHKLAAAVPKMPIIAHSTLNRAEITCAAEAVKPCRQPRLILDLVSNPDLAVQGRVQSYTDWLMLVESYIQFGSRLGLAVDIAVHDASVVDPAFLARFVEMAASVGAKGITLIFSGDESTEQFCTKVKRVVRTVPTVPVGVRCSNSADTGATVALAAVEQGATEVGAVVTPWRLKLPVPSLHALTMVGLVRVNPQLIDWAAVMLAGLIDSDQQTQKHASVAASEDTAD